MSAGIVITDAAITGTIATTGAVIIIGAIITGIIVIGADRGIIDIDSLQGFDAARDRGLARFGNLLRDHHGLIEML